MKKFIPDVDQQGSGLKKRDEGSFFRMVLALARHNCFDEYGNIKNNAGETIQGTNIAKLVSFVCRPETKLDGIDEFVALLKQLGIEDVPNKNAMCHASSVKIPVQSVEAPLQSVEEPVIEPVRPPNPTTVPLPSAYQSTIAQEEVQSSMHTVPSPSISGESVPLPTRPPSVAMKRKRKLGGPPQKKKMKVEPRRSSRLTWQMRD